MKDKSFIKILEDIIENVNITENEPIIESKRKEGYSYENKKGQVKFLESKGDEPYLQNILELISKRKNISISDLKTELKNMIKQREERKELSPILLGTTFKNVGETCVFDLVEKYLDNKDLNDLVDFDSRIFMKIYRSIKSEIPNLFPLKNPFNPVAIKPTIYFIDPDEPNPNLPAGAENIGTAACSPDAQLIFNVPFMKRLLLFGKMKGLKASPNKKHGSKYISNGGKIPDEYAYLEFTIIHELMHYHNGDFYFEKAMKLDGTTVNWVGDFVTNYDLVKNEYPQLPLGLFNEEINYDHYKSWVEMYEVVKKEKEKLKEEGNYDDVKQEMDKTAADDMPDEGEGYEGSDNQQGQEGEGFK
jgi:hypothetical protein